LHRHHEEFSLDSFYWKKSCFRKAGATSILALATLIIGSATLPTPAAHAQAVSVNGGSIQGTITDNTGAVVPGATVLVTGIDTGSKATLTTDSKGYWSIGPLNPGNYDVVVTAGGFEKTDVKTVIRTGTATSGNFKLTVGSSAQTIEVNAGAVQLNTDQAGVSDVITSQQIQNLPVNGRNFLDLAQIEPGVILQSGESFDPTKAGYSAISVGGVSGRTTRILLDGQDITDETVGTTIFNVSQGAINEFQLNRSTQDVSGEVTSTGQVLVSTNSGTNSFHGQTFYYFQDARAGFADLTGGLSAPFQRNQYGGSIGGPIIKDKLFFFANAERIQQVNISAATTSPTFAAITSQFPNIPFGYKETYSTGRLDYTGWHGIHFFGRVNYDVNAVGGNFGFLYSIYANRDNTPGFAGGADFVTGHFTHSFRGSYEKFHNLISDSVTGNSSLYNPIPGLTLYDSQDGFFAGINYLSPQTTFQSDKQFRYDGTWTHGAHTFKYGYSLNRILGGGGAEFFGASLFTSFGQGSLLAGGPGQLGCNNVMGGPACPGDPVNGYATNGLTLGNGNQVFTEKPGFNLPGGGTFDWREGAYVADTWKVKPTFTLNAGVRWSVDTDRANQDLPTPPCSSVDAAINPCTGGQTNLFDVYQPGLGKKTHQPYGNWGPQLGFAYNPGGKNTVLRAGVGIFYESDVFNNTSNARSAVINSSGPFFNDTGACGGTTAVAAPGGKTITEGAGVPLSTLCSESIAAAAPGLLDVLHQYQAATQANNTASNPSYIGHFLNSSGVYAAPYLTPYSFQYNFGIQQQIGKGTVISGDYVHNSTIKIPLVIDVNRVGAARTLNADAAKFAIAHTLALCGVGTVDAAIRSCPGIHSDGSGAVIQDFAGGGDGGQSGTGLDSGNALYGGYPASVIGVTPATGAAFPGLNPAVGFGKFILPTGQSGYDALQIVFKQVKQHPAPGIENANFQVSYNLSRIVGDVSTTGNTGNSGDNFFNSPAYDNDNPSGYIGRLGLDHKHELSFGGFLALKYGLQMGFAGHFFSALPTTLSMDNSNGEAAQIFQTDVTGDGTTADLLPGTRPGAYMHDYKAKTLQSFITNYNSRYANTLTPAGQALVSNGILTSNQLVALQGAQQPLANIPGGHAINNPAFRTMDVNLSYPIRLARLHEGMSLEPAIAFYNIGNFSNFGLVSGQLLTQTNVGPFGPANFLNGPDTPAVADGNRTQRGSGTFDAGGPRSLEYQLKFNF
jgi:Carboxypeptidase regulatory-like domain